MAFVTAGADGDGKAVGFERNMSEVRIEVTMSENDRPGLLRSSMYQRAGLTSARVRVSCRVDCQGRRRYRSISIHACSPVQVGRTYNGESHAHKRRYTPDHIIDLLANWALSILLGLLLLFSLVQGAMSAPQQVDVWQQAPQRNTRTAPSSNIEPALAIHALDVHGSKLSRIVQMAHDQPVEDAKRE